MTKSLHQTAADFIAAEPQLAREIARQIVSRNRKEQPRYGLTPRQRDVLDFIEAYAGEHQGITPTYDEIVTGLGLTSKGRAYRLVEALAQRGYIIRLFNRPRSIRLADEVTP